MAALLVNTAFAAEYNVRNGKVTQAAPRPMAHSKRAMDVPVPTVGGTTMQQPAILINADRTNYVPGDEIRITALNTGDEITTALSIQVSEIFIPWGGTDSISSDVYQCDCGGSNGGFLPHGMNQFQSIEVVRKRINPGRTGTFTFWVTVTEWPNNGTSGQQTQQTQFSVISGSASNSPRVPLVVNSITRFTEDGQDYFFLTGMFPQGQGLYSYTGIENWYGSFSDTPTSVSADGKTLIVPAIYADDHGQFKSEGHVILMTGDLSMSTVSPAFSF